MTSKAAGGELTDTLDVITGEFVTVTSRNRAAETAESAWAALCKAITATNADRQTRPSDPAVRHFEVR